MATRPESKAHEVLLGKYEVGRLLGRGTFAKVYYARSLADGSAVAVKVLDKPKLAATGMGPRLLREVNAMRRLSHPNIIHLHEVMATKSKVYLVVEHAPGGELLSRLRRLSESTARRYFHQLLSALRFCHARGVAHRDVKPQNLLLDRHGDLKVSDFGLSALPEHRRDGRLHTSCGTPAYAAPEVLGGKGYDGSRADAWSCGVILFVLLAGFLPFDDSNIPLMYRKIVKKDYRFPPWFSPAARRVVSRLLDPNPETRITLDAVMELPWFKRSYSLDPQLGLLQRTLSATAINAFDIISMSPELNLSGLFDGGRTRENRFTSTASLERILERIEETGAKLGYATETMKGGGGGGKWGSVLTVEVLEVAAPLVLVELRSGGAGDGEGICWEDLKAQLGDIVFAWYNNGDAA